MVSAQHKDKQSCLCSQLEKTQANVLCFLAECPIHQGAERLGRIMKGGFTQLLVAWSQQKAKTEKDARRPNRNQGLSSLVTALQLHQGSLAEMDQNWWVGKGFLLPPAVFQKIV